MEVRPAGLDDVETLASLRWAFRSEMDEPSEPPQSFTRRMTAWLTHVLVDGHWYAYFPVEGGQAVGLVFVQLVEKLPNPVSEPEHLGYVTSLYVSPTHRGRGVGESLLSAAVAFCRDREVDTVVLWPSFRSVTLYERLGFRRPAEVMELALADHPGRSNSDP